MILLLALVVLVRTKVLFTILIELFFISWESRFFIRIWSQLESRFLWSDRLSETLARRLLVHVNWVLKRTLSILSAYRDWRHWMIRWQRVFLCVIENAVSHGGHVFVYFHGSLRKWSKQFIDQSSSFPYNFHILCVLLLLKIELRFLLVWWLDLHSSFY